jgi:GTPase SAR1 family protein
MEEWIKFAREENPQMPILMVGAKLDLKDMINVTDEIRAPYLKKYAFNHIMVSSKTGEGVPEMLNLLVDELIKTKVNPKPNP